MCGSLVSPCRGVRANDGFRSVSPGVLRQVLGIAAFIRMWGFPALEFLHTSLTPRLTVAESWSVIQKLGLTKCFFVCQTYLWEHMI